MTFLDLDEVLKALLILVCNFTNKPRHSRGFFRVLLMCSIFRIVVDGRDILVLISDRLLALRTSDEFGMESDELQVGTSFASSRINEMTGLIAGYVKRMGDEIVRRLRRLRVNYFTFRSAQHLLVQYADQSLADKPQPFRAGCLSCCLSCWR